MPLQAWAVDCADPDRLAEFWTLALGYEVAEPPDGHPTWAAFSAAVGADGETWSRIIDRRGLGSPVLFHRVPEPKVTKNRLHLDVLVRPRRR